MYRLNVIVNLLLCIPLLAFAFQLQSSLRTRQRASGVSVSMAVNNDAFSKANRASRSVGGDDRVIEILLPLGMELAETEEGDVFVKSIEPNGRAAKTGKVFVGDRVTMVSATFGNDMWSTRGVGLGRVLSAIKVRNTKPVRIALEVCTYIVCL
jgi:hypothetical protein